MDKLGASVWFFDSLDRVPKKYPVNDQFEAKY